MKGDTTNRAVEGGLNRTFIPDDEPVLLNILRFHTNFIFYGLNFLAIPALVVLHTTVVGDHRGRSWYEPRMLLLVWDHLFPLALRQVGKPFGFVISLFGSRLKSGAGKTVGKVSAGLVIALPLLLIVISLLSSADAAFSRMMAEIPAWIGSLINGEGLFRFLWIVLMFMLLFSYMWGFAAPKKEDGHDVAGAESLRQDLAVGHRIWFDPIITLTVLAAVNLIYVLFVAVQFSYLFGAWQGNLPEGMTYAEQARSGFFELITVALINLLILTLTLTLSRWDNSTLQRWNRALLTALVVCTGIMLISAFIRLQLYEQVYGYTYSRFLSHAFMIYLAALLLLAGIRIWRPAVSLIRTFVLTSLLAYTLINYIGMDRMIADLNIRQYHKTGILDTAYLQSLSDEAIGRMIVFHRETGMLGEHLTQRHESLMQETRSILSYNLSRHLAYKALEREL